MARAIDSSYLLQHKRKVMFFGLGPDDERWGYAVPVEVIESAPTLTPQNEWVSVEDRMPEELKMVLVYCGGLYDVAGWVKDEEDKICWTCKTEPEFWRPIPELDG